jgi:hypothetical protein
MSAIEVSSGLQAVITPHGHYRFHWMGDHWKQEIACDGGCEAIPRIWSIEGQTTHDGHLATASPTFERLNLKQVGPQEIVARLEGHVDSRRASAVFTFEEQPEGVVVNVEVKVQGAEPGEEPIATYLIESSDGQLERGEAVTITWSNPETTLVFEAEPPSRVEAHEAGMGTIRLKALGSRDPATEVQTLRYRWKWNTKPWHQIWDREV